MIGDELPSPLFTPRPGWGGQLRHACRQAGAWLRENASVTVFRLVLLAAIALVAISIAKRPPTSDIALPTESPAPLGTMTLTVQPGQDAYHLAAVALQMYLATRSSTVTLDPVERLWATDRIARTISPDRIAVGQTLVIATDTIESGIAQAKALSPTQRANLAPYIR